MLDVALLGFGNVGQAFASYVTNPVNKLTNDLRIRAVADSSGGIFLNDQITLERTVLEKRTANTLARLDPERIDTDSERYFRKLANIGIEAVVEALPTNISNGEPAIHLIISALKAGLNVVSVDKGPLVHGFELLHRTARAHNVQILFSGTTGVSVPDDVRSENVLEIRGVLNGTTNYVLTEMQLNGRSFEEALKRAQDEGIAEPDPTLDIEGWDTAAKILILARSLMNCDSRIEDVSRIGIGPETQSLIDIAQEKERIVRLVGRARIWQGRVRVSVAPKLITPDSPFYSVNGTSKLAVFRTSETGNVIVTSRSGRDAIAKTIVDDLRQLNMRK